MLHTQKIKLGYEKIILDKRTHDSKCDNGLNNVLYKHFRLTDNPKWQPQNFTRDTSWFIITRKAVHPHYNFKKKQHKTTLRWPCLLELSEVIFEEIIRLLIASEVKQVTSYITGGRGNWYKSCNKTI